MSMLTLALPSKGRLKEQVEAWLADCGFPVRSAGGARGYTATLDGLPQIEVQLLSAGDIAAALHQGEVHVGVTGEDLLREQGDAVPSRVTLLRALGFGRADLVVAAPRSWIDVDTMADLEEVGAAYLARTGGRMRVATKYLAQTRAYFAANGVYDYRIVESSGATEGAPAAGAAEVIVDITTTGATLAANNLKILKDGVILKSEAQFAASHRADWSAEGLESLRYMMRVVEARARARDLVTLVWPAESAAAAEASTESFLSKGATRRANGLLVQSRDLFDTAASLAQGGVGPVSAARPDYVFEPASAAVDAFEKALSSRK